MATMLAHAVSLAALLLVQGIAGLGQETAPPPVAAAVRIGAGDLIQISVYGSGDLSGSFRVDEKGEITLPLLGPVQVAGETAEEAGTAIAKRYVGADILKARPALVTVSIAEYATQGIVVNGEVQKPGVYPALGVRMLNEVMVAAGGVTPQASSQVVILRREDPTHPVKVTYDPTAATPVIPRVQLFPGDTVMVPNAGGVYVLGRVTKPGLYLLEERRTLTVEKALALAGGIGGGANSKHSHIVRTLADGRKEDIVFDSANILKGKSADIALKDGDILYVPVSTSKVIMQQAIADAISMGTMILTFRLTYY